MGGESILLFCDNVIMGFSGLNQAAFDGEKTGRLFLTSHRMVFNNKSSNDPLKSFSFPFVALRNVELEQPVFGANYIKGKVLAQPKEVMKARPSSSYGFAVVEQSILEVPC